MKGISLPALTEEQRYFAAKVLSETTGMDWEGAAKATRSTPGVVFSSQDEAVLTRLKQRLESAGLSPEVQTVAGQDLSPRMKVPSRGVFIAAFVVILVVGGLVLLRGTRSTTSTRVAHPMDLTVAHGEFVLKITNNDDSSAYRNCRVEVDSRYSFPLPTLAPPFRRGFADPMQWERASYPSSEILSQRHRLGEISSDVYLAELKKAQDRITTYVGWERGKARAVGDTKSFVSIHLGDFRRGAERYDWQRKAPTRVVVECEDRASIGGSTQEWNSDISQTISVPQWVWNVGVSRWVGTPSEK